MTEEQKAAFMAKMEDIAKILGWDIEGKDTSWNPSAYLTKKMEDGKSAKLLLRDMGEGKRLSVIVTYPTFHGQSCRPYHAKDQDITVSADKTAEQIAKDIERRVLPTYLPDLATAWKQYGEADAYSRRKADMTLALAQAFGAVLHEGRDEIYPSEPWNKAIYRIKIVSDCEMEMEVRGSAELALKVMATVGDFLGVNLGLGI